MLMLLLLKYAAILLVTVVLGAFIAYCGYIYHVRSKFSHLPGPPISNFLTGMSKYFEEVYKGEITSPEVILKGHKEYGPVMKLFGFHLAFVSVTDPAIVKTLLMNKEHLKPAVNYRNLVQIFGERFAGRGLVSVIDHETWERHRRIFNPAFHRKHLLELNGSFNDSADKLVQFFNKVADGKTEVRMMDGFQKVTLDVIWKAAFGMEDDLVLQDTPFAEAVQDAFRGSLQAQQNPLLQYDFRKASRELRNKVKQSLRLLRKTGEDIIRKRIESQKKGKEMPKDILSFIIKAAMEEEGFNMQEMVDEFVTFFIAGQETTGNMLGFTMIQLGQNPDVMKKLVAEVDLVVGKKKVISYQDLMKLEYMSLVMKETLRINPPVSGASRVANHDLECAGYKIPAGSNVILLSFVMARMEQFFKDPMRFNPERFQKDEDSPLYTYFPFSLGPRSCIGQNFAQMEAKIILSKLLQNFTFDLVPSQSFAILDQQTLTPKGGCTNVIHRREDGPRGLAEENQTD